MAAQSLEHFRKFRPHRRIVGAVLGGGAGTAGAAYTGEKEIVLPAESTLSFKLTEPVTIKM